MDKEVISMEREMFIMMTLIIVLLFLIIILITRLMNILKKINISLEKIKKIQGVPEPLEDEILKTFITNKEKIKAIKRYRVLTGAELKEANDYIEKLIEKQEKDD